MGRKIFPCISIRAVALCQLRCKNCPAKYWVENNNGFQTTIDQLSRFISCVKESDYRYELLCISGGEPFLWKHLEEGLVMINNANIADRIHIYTNLMWFDASKEQFTRKIASLVDMFAISKYPVNAKRCEIFNKMKIKARDNIWIKNKRETLFVRETRTPIPNALPAECGCSVHTMYGDDMDACGGLRFMTNMLNRDIGKYDKFTTKVCNNYVDKLDMNGVINMDLCAMCMANSKVKKVVGLERHSQQT